MKKYTVGEHTSSFWSDVISFGIKKPDEVIELYTVIIHMICYSPESEVDIGEVDIDGVPAKTWISNLIQNRILVSPDDPSFINMPNQIVTDFNFMTVKDLDFTYIIQLLKSAIESKFRSLELPYSVISVSMELV